MAQLIRNGNQNGLKLSPWPFPVETCLYVLQLGSWDRKSQTSCQSNGNGLRMPSLRGKVTPSGQKLLLSTGKIKFVASVYFCWRVLCAEQNKTRTCILSHFAGHSNRMPENILKAFSAVCQNMANLKNSFNAGTMGSGFPHTTTKCLIKFSFSRAEFCGYS